MKRTLLATALLAAMTIPAFAEEPANTTVVQTEATTSETGNKRVPAPTELGQGRPDCMQRHSSSMTMM